MGRREFERQPIMRQMLANTPITRFGTADEVAAVANFLLSDDASFVTGIDVSVDGGARAVALTSG
jgi:NAD(P)-dependent dehydrogenase (short-subunit alcohol dehydrogenase family)